MKLILADESVDFNIVKKLREEKHEIKAVIEISPGITDEEVLELANKLKAILLTEDTDFGELTYRLKLPNHGIILLRMGGEDLELKLTQLKLLFKNYADKLSNSFSVVTIKKIRVVKQNRE